jgi:hypothetical protein
MYLSVSNLVDFEFNIKDTFKLIVSIKERMNKRGEMGWDTLKIYVLSLGQDL